MSETRWLVRTLPTSPLSDTLLTSGCELTLCVATDAEEVVQAVEEAARRNGMLIERLPSSPSVIPPVYPATS